MMPENCPNCGAPVPPNAKACPECGSDEKTGWSDEACDSGLDLPDAEFNYSEYVQREFGGRSPVPHGVPWFWWVVGVIILGAVLMIWVF